MNVTDTLLRWIELGGPVMVVLLALSVLALALIIAKTWEFHDLRIGDARFVAPALREWHAGRHEQALSALGRHPSPLAALLRETMVALDRPNARLEAVREQAAQWAAEKLDRVRSGLRVLEVVAALAPLLGLLGTVLGMIEAFQRLQEAGDRVDPAILSGGIWQALLTTAAGLAIAIPVVAVLNWLDARVARLHGEMQGALTRLLVEPLEPEDTPGGRRAQERAAAMAVPLKSG